MKAIHLLVLFFIFAVASCTPPDRPEVKKWPADKLTITNNKTLVIVFDGSSSMEGEKFAQAKKALSVYTEALPPEVKVGLVAFYDDQIWEMSAIGESREKLRLAMNNLSCGGGTPLGAAVFKAQDMLYQSAASSGFDGEYHLVIITDGEANDSWILGVVTEDIMKQTPVRLTTIGFRISESHSLNRPGIKYISAEDEKEIGKGLQRVLAEKEE